MEAPSRGRFRLLAQVASAIAVALSLVFVGLEVRETAEQTRLNTLSLRASALNGITAQATAPLLALANDSELADAYVRWRDGSGDLTVAEDVQVRLFVFALLRNAENVFLQTALGAVDSTALLGYGLTNTPAFEAPAFAEYWREFRSRFHPDFVAAFEPSYGL